MKYEIDKFEHNLLFKKIYNLSLYYTYTFIEFIGLININLFSLSIA